MFDVKAKTKDVLIALLLFIFVISFWVFTYHRTINVTPRYTGQLEPVRTLKWNEIWTWTDYGHYHRYSPIGLLAVGLIDREIIAPAFGIDPMDKAFSFADRLVPVYFALFAGISVLTFFFCRYLSFGVLPSILAGLYIGVNDGFSYFFYYVDTIAACLLMIFSIGLLFCWIKYNRNNSPLYLIGYYLFFLLIIGTWDQWINMLACIVFFSIFLAVKNKENRRRIIVHGILIPFLLFTIFFIFRSPSIFNEIGRTSEAQYVFSYPSKALMLEDMVSNISHHIAGSIDALFFPWPMMSQAVIKKIDINQYNQYNLFSAYSDIHYRAFTEWYVGLLFGVFLCGLIAVLNYLRKNWRQSEILILSLLLVFTGFLTHLPVMFRVYFDLPGYVGLLNYKNLITVFGVSLLLGYFINKIMQQKPTKLTTILIILLNFWIINNNYQKIFLNFIFKRSQFPW